MLNYLLVIPIRYIYINIDPRIVKFILAILFFYVGVFSKPTPIYKISFLIVVINCDSRRYHCMVERDSLLFCIESSFVLIKITKVPLPSSSILFDITIFEFKSNIPDVI